MLPSLRSSPAACVHLRATQPSVATPRPPARPDGCSADRRAWHLAAHVVDVRWPVRAVSPCAALELVVVDRHAPDALALLLLLLLRVPLALPL
jgi:hypothetical protein